MYIYCNFDNNDCQSQLFGFEGCKNVNMKKIHKCELVVYYSNYAMLYFIILNYMSIIDANNSKCKKIY